MKKVLKVLAVVAVIILVAYSAIATIAATSFSYERDRYMAQVQELEAEIEALQAETEGTDISTIRGIAYELLFDNVYYGEEYDLTENANMKVEQYELSEFEEAELWVMLEALVSRYSLEN